MLTAQGLGMAPYCPYINTDTVEINSRHVMFTGELEEEIYNAYQEKFGSGIILSSPSISVVDK